MSKLQKLVFSQQSSILVSQSGQNISSHYDGNYVSVIYVELNKMTKIGF